MSVLAHNGVAKAYYNDEVYDKAMEHFEIAGNRDGYSNAFWEVRNKSIQKWLGTVLIVLVILIAIRLLSDSLIRIMYLRKRKSSWTKT